jgi:hypothetical protein
MAAPPIAGSNRYIPESVTRYYWVVTFASYNSPTRAELDAGTDLTPEIAAVGDWAINGAAVAAPDLATLFDSQIQGKISMGTTTIDIYADLASVDARTLMPRSALGNVVKFPEGDIAGHKMDVFPVRVLAQPKPTNMGNPSVIQFQYVVLHTPAENVAVPT